MLRHVQSLRFANNSSFLRARNAKDLSRAFLQPRAHFWFNSKNEEKEDTGAAVSETTRSDNSLVAQFGDGAPRPSTLLVLPIDRRPIFPGFVATINVKDEATCNALSASMEAGKKSVGLFLRTDYNDNLDIPEPITSESQLYMVGTFANIAQMVKTDVGLQLFVLGHRRMSLNNIESYGPPIIANVSHWKKPIMVEQTTAIKAYCNEILASVRELIKINPLAQEHLQQFISRVDLSDPYRLADFAAAITTADGRELQKVLQTSDAEERLQLALDLLSKEREVVKFQREISKQVEEKMSKQQREYFLHQQLKSIKQELGIERDDKDELAKKYNEAINAFSDKQFLNKQQILKVIGEEMKKLSALEKNSPEFNVCRSYLDWLTSIPHGNTSKDRLHLQVASSILDQDHYGLDDVKKRILEFIAVGKLNGNVSGKIICFIGPPGVGKTSIAKSIANALGRKFYRFSVGGLTDIAEVKGHRRTYIGAMPGKPVQCLKNTGVMNPLILIDEIDKLGRGHSGDPASTLLELLDPNQNSSFVDHYMDVPLDFSNVLFVCTANDESAIPGPLRDRMEIIRIAGYDIPEKVAIASKYLVPKILKDSGLLGIENFSVKIKENALESLVKNYCRESGVRSLEMHIEKIARKIAFDAVGKIENQAKCNDAPQLVKDTSSTEDKSEMHDKGSEDKENDKEKVEETLTLSEPQSIEVTSDNLETYVGKKKFLNDNIYDSDSDHALPVGIVMGLAWNPLGGSPVFVETAALPTTFNETGGGFTSITGQLGNVMKESVNIAYTFARKFVIERDNANKFFQNHSLHVHVPEGAVEKDGPSAGITMATSLISIALNKSVRPRLAMTGELSLTGKVLPVGGIKEKTLAAKRSGADTVILPAANKRDFNELPQYVKDSVKVHFVSEYKEVFEIAFGHNK